MLPTSTYFSDNFHVVYLTNNRTAYGATAAIQCIHGQLFDTEEGAPMHRQPRQHSTAAVAPVGDEDGIVLSCNELGQWSSSSSTTSSSSTSGNKYDDGGGSALPDDGPYHNHGKLDKWKCTKNPCGPPKAVVSKLIFVSQCR